MKRKKTVNKGSVSKNLKGFSGYLNLFKRKEIFFSLGILLVFAVSIITIRWMVPKSEDGFIINLPSPRTYRAVVPMSYVDKEATARFRELATRGVEGVVVYEPVNKENVLKKARLLNPADLEKTDLSERLKDLLLEMPVEDLERILSLSAEVIGDILGSESMIPRSPDEFSTRIWQELENRDMERSLQNIVFQVISSLLVPQSSMDSELTEELKTNLRQKVEPVVRTLSPGDIIVSEGDKITGDIASVLRGQGYPESSFPIKQIFLIIFALILWMSWFSRMINEEEYNFKAKNGWIYSSTLIGLGWSAMYISDLAGVPGSGLLTLAGFAYLTLPRKPAFHLVLGGALTGAFLIEGFSAGVIVITGLMGYAAALAGYYMVSFADSRSLLWRKLFLCGIIISAIGLSGQWLIGMNIPLSLLTSYLFANAFWSVLILVLLPVLENLFDVLSPLRLIELSQPSHVLLKKLQVEAPGTYHHSVMVSALAEPVSERLGLDTALLKAGCYYHDIGKLKRPHYYIENQMSGDNVHDTISPTLSALSIIAHVREGIQIAREYKLPGRIIDFISEHHGRTCVSYFYRKARKQSEEDVASDQFCYPGPVPHSKETGLLMIIDSVEAAVRSDVENIRTRQDLEKIIESVLDSKLSAHQLDEVDFTLKDLQVIKDVLLDTLHSMYHTRRVQSINEKPDEELPKNKEDFK